MFVKSIASVSKQNIAEKLQSAKSISLTMDGSTDFTGDDLHSIYTRSCSNGIIEDNLLYIGEAESAGSADLDSFLKKLFSDLHLTDVMTSKLVGFCADGAPNMQGLSLIINYYLLNFSNISAISWRPVLVVEEAGENPRSWANNW